MQRKNQSLLITNNTKKENSLKKIIQDYQQDQSKDYKLVVLGNRMQIQEP